MQKSKNAKKNFGLKKNFNKPFVSSLVFSAPQFFLSKYNCAIASQMTQFLFVISGNHLKSPLILRLFNFLRSGIGIALDIPNGF
jgi:hypothetical protein